MVSNGKTGRIPVRSTPADKNSVYVAPEDHQLWSSAMHRTNAVGMIAGCSYHDYSCHIATAADEGCESAAAIVNTITEEQRRSFMRLELSPEVGPVPDGWAPISLSDEPVKFVLIGDIDRALADRVKIWL